MFHVARVRRVRSAVVTVALASVLLAAPPGSGRAAPAPMLAEPSGAAVFGADTEVGIPGFLLDRGRYTTIVAPGAVFESEPTGINERGQIVGQFTDASGVEHGFLRDRHGRYRTIDVPGARGTVAVRISDSGAVVGAYSERSPNVKDPDAAARGFLLDRGRLTRIDVPGAVLTQATGVNNRRQVVGDYLDAAGRLHGFLWDRGRFTTIDVPGAGRTSAYAINNRGQIVGVYDPDGSGATMRGFVLDRGRFTTIAAPGVPVTAPFDINDRGQVVGYTDADPTQLLAHGFLFDRGRFTRIDVPGAPRSIAWGINDHGRIVGIYENPNAGPGTIDARR